MIFHRFYFENMGGDMKKKVKREKKVNSKKQKIRKKIVINTDDQW